MANSNGHGGHRTPTHPAAVSGPGAHSRRTDGNFQSVSTVPDQPYGAAKQQAAAQKLAPMAGKEPMPTPSPVSQPQEQPSDFQMPAYTGGAFNAPSARPDEPVTAGAPVGAGPGPEVLNQQAPALPPVRGTMSTMLQQMSATDTTGLLGQLYLMARQRGV